MPPDRSASQLPGTDDLPWTAKAAPVRRKVQAIAAIILVLPSLALLLAWHMHLDFWHDEVYTFDHFVFVPLWHTLSDYHVPNNHVLLNLINNVYVSCLGFNGTESLMDRPWIIRGLMLVYAAGAVWYTWRIANRNLSPLAGWTAVLVLVTTVPFTNFAAQVRGYSLSMWLLTVALYYLLEFDKSGRWQNAVGVVIAAALLVYTIPSNVYVLLSIAACCAAALRGPQALAALPSGQGSDCPAILPSQDAAHRSVATGILYSTTLTLLPLAGIAAGGLLYLPMLKQMVGHDYLRSNGLFNMATLTHQMPEVLWALLSGRYLLLAAVMAGGTACLVSSRRRNRRLAASRYALFASLLVLPFVASFIRGDQPPSRIFVVLAPVAALLIASSVEMVRPQDLSRRVTIVAVLAGALYCYATLALCLADTAGRLQADILQGHKNDAVSCMYYLGCYEPSTVLADLARHYHADPTPIFVCDYGDDYALPRYLQRSRLPARKIVDPGQIQYSTRGRAYMLTAYPYRFMDRLRQMHPRARCQLLTQPARFQSVLLCQEGAEAGQ